MTLQQELSTDPTGKGYAQHLPDSPGAVCDLLNAATESMVQPITPSTALVWAASGPMSAIVDASTNTANPARASALSFLSSLNAPSMIHMDDPEVAGMFAQWVPGIITQEQHDALMAKATQPASRAQVLGLPPVTVYDLIAAGVA